MLLQTLAKAGYTEQDILDGSADLHEVVKIYKDIPKKTYHPSFLLPPYLFGDSLTFFICYHIQRRTEICDRVFFPVK